MGFGLFKKKTSADLVLVNGFARTMDPDLPHAEAVACGEGRILAVGDRAAIEPLITGQTLVVDLEGRFLTPGWLDLHSDPIPWVFEDQYLALSERMTKDRLLSSVLTYIADHPAEERYLAYGYDPTAVAEGDIPDIRQALNEAALDKPAVLVACDGHHMILNTPAAEAVAKEAEELDMPAVTPALVTSVLLSADMAALQKNLAVHAYSLAQKGFTGEFVLPSFGHFESIYRELLVDAYQEDLLKQRYFGSLLLNAPLPERLVLHQMAQKSTACAELKGLIQFNTLCVHVSSAQDSCHFIGESYLKSLCSLAADKGYHIRITALDHSAAVSALALLSELKASYKKSSFAVALKEQISEEERSAILSADVYEYFPGDEDPSNRSAQAMLEKHTIRGAEQLGLSGQTGTIEAGKWADLAVFEQDPGIQSESPPQAWMTILNGSVVYDSRRDTEHSWIREYLQSAFRMD